MTHIAKVILVQKRYQNELYEPLKLVMISFILVTLMFDSGVIFQGEIRC